MKSLLTVIIVVVFYSCATTNKTTNKAIDRAIVGQNEMTVFSRLGPPTKKTPTPDGGKIMIYEFYSKGMYTTPYKSSVTYNPNRNVTGNREGLTYTRGVNTKTNSPEYTISPTNVSYLKVYLDEQGNCVRFEQNLPKEQLEIYHESFKHFLKND